MFILFVCYELLVQFEASPEPDEVGKCLFLYCLFVCLFVISRWLSLRRAPSRMRWERVSMAESDLKWLKTGGMGDTGK